MSVFKYSVLAASAALLSLPFTSAVTFAPQFFGCVTTAYTPDGIARTGQTSATTCANACYSYSTSYIYSAWVSSTSSCTCATTSPTAAEITTGNAGNCGATYEVDVTHTSFSYYECTSQYSFTSFPVQSSATTIEAAFVACEHYPLMAIWPNDLFYYACGSGTISGDTSTTCAHAINRLYTHPADATASGYARRALNNRRRMIEQQRLEVQYCPQGLTACALDGDSSSYECLDTTSELESCGGCLHGNYLEPGSFNSTTQYGGRDCSAIKGVAMGESTCLNGQCQFHCAKGYKRQDDACIKA